jgi:AAA15 family ATPase/GTPase
LEYQEERIPLKSLGDGVTRVFHIILSLVNAKGGVLLIDEFENGLHWAVQQSVWDIVFQLAETLDVQVFCTTHSRDCINGFGSVWKKYPESGAFFRLFERNKTVLAQEYDIETLSDSLETDVEVR